MKVIGGGTDMPHAKQRDRTRLVDIRLGAAGVARHGPKVLVTALEDLLHRSRLPLSHIDAVVLPEGNADYFCSELEAAGMSHHDYDHIQHKVVENLEDVGATGSPAVLLALEAGIRDGRICPGHTVLLVAIEASRYLYAGVSIRWAAPMAGALSRLGQAQALCRRPFLKRSALVRRQCRDRG